MSNAYPKQATNAIPFVITLSVKYSPTVFSWWVSDIWYVYIRYCATGAKIPYTETARE